jgi:glycosyltransferase involved in cell wall biosynthesis
MMAAHVLYIAWAPFFSGAERALLLTLRSLDPDRYRPSVLAGTDGEFASQVRALGIPCDVVSLRSVERRHPLAGAMSVAAVLNAARRYRASLIHVNELPSFQPGGYAARLLRIPSITHIRFPDRAAGYQWFSRPGFSLALFVSTDLLDAARNEAPSLFEGRSDVLHDGVEIQPTWSDEERIRCRRALGLPAQAAIVAITGQIAAVKGIWDFVDAARLLADRAAEPLFVVLGDDLKEAGKTRRMMEERVAALGLTNRFKFLGFRLDAPTIVQAFDVIAVPSHVEPLGNATLEAMAAGRPVVGTRVGGIPEMVIDGTTGSLVPASKPAALAEAIEQLVRQPALRAAMAAAARQRARDVFGIEAHGRKLQAQYDRVCSRRVVEPDIEREFA